MNLLEGACGHDGMPNVNWEVTQRSKLLGGLGIGDFRYHNNAFMAKWIWRFLHEQDALWRKLIVA